ncbi:adenine phosphoribosyltransferase [Anaerotignum sp. MB30-C6]|uniref:adenine phosphoribosyltransferase n=1 Tax=Anaerotignum sp. MB30-C6 TaxID=3070814 RepID=UPI0027DB1A00|nr:adenine phosphoribosyltransferase [Anaerotignum sp. MB30-C6]WMI80711.1 adenine phosphoribosyltransferase [Anaerotignum sp. MB30-C6]
MELKDKIRSIPDYPETGVIFRDITTLLKDADGLVEAVDQMQKKLEGLEFDLILGPESRGFIFGMPIAYNLKKGFIPIRKKGKLPAEVVSKEYSLEYGTSTIEMHKDAVQPGQKVVIVDDLLATGGTAKALVEMVEEIGAEVVSLNFLIELDFLKGRDVLDGYKVETVIHY